MTTLSQTLAPDALTSGRLPRFTVPVVAVAFEFRFLGGSMGSVVGERFVRAVQTAQSTGRGCQRQSKPGRSAAAADGDAICATWLTRPSRCPGWRGPQVGESRAC